METNRIAGSATEKKMKGFDGKQFEQNARVIADDLAREHKRQRRHRFWRGIPMAFLWLFLAACAIVLGYAIVKGWATS